MGKNRLEAFSDGVLAIIITIMVLGMEVPHGSEWSDVATQLPVFLSYVLSFLYIGIYWNNHHHLLHTVHRVSAGILWANLHLLFWLSLLPFATGWAGEHHGIAPPTALYGMVLLLSAVAYFILQGVIVASHGRDSALAKSLGADWKGKLSMVAYLTAIVMAFVLPWISDAIYAAVVLAWVIPDRRVERALDRI